VDTGISRFYHYDMQGNTRFLTDSAGNVTDTYSYNAFGEELSSSGSASNPHRFGGQVGYYRDKIERVYVQARHYAPDLGRWMSPDPLGFDGGDWNLYRYVSNDPVGQIDPSGMDCPKRCQGANNQNQDPLIKSPPTCPQPHHYAAINTLCDVDQKLFAGIAGLPDKYFVATTFCCCDPTRGKPSDRESTVGCTEYFGKFHNLPDVYKGCLIEHEQRRRSCCKTTGSAGTTKIDNFLFLLCVWNKLNQCFPGRAGWVRSRFPRCKPPNYTPSGPMCS
jgi:RHS repeat-associated protein